MHILKGMTAGDVLDRVIAEALESQKQRLHSKALEEKEKQVSLSSKNDQGQSGDSNGEDQADFDAIKDKESSKTMSDDTEALKGDVKLDDVVEKLNTIRAGKSFKDSLVTQRFDEYFNSLSSAERVAMFAFLKGIAQVVSGEVEPEEVTDPEDKPADVHMHKGPHKQEKNVKPNVIKKPPPPAGDRLSSTSNSSKEDTSAPIRAQKR